MNRVMQSHVIMADEGGRELAAVRVTQEANGVAIWHDPIHADARLLAWHGFSPNRDASGILDTALAEAALIAAEAIDHGLAFSSCRNFAQR